MRIAVITNYWPTDKRPWLCHHDALSSDVETRNHCESEHASEVRAGAQSYALGRDEKLRIAVVTPFFPTRELPQNGRPTYQLVKQLNSFADTRVFCTIPRYVLGTRPRGYQYFPIDRPYSVADLEVEFIEFPALPLVSRLANGQACARALHDPVKRFLPHVLLNYWIYPQGYAAVAVGRKLSIPAVVGAIGSDLQGINDPVTLHFTRKTIRSAAAVTCKSAQLAARAVALTSATDRVRTIANGCDASLFRPGSREEARQVLGINPAARLVLFVGRLQVAKGVCDLLHAVARIRVTDPRVEVALVGAGTDESEVRKTAQHLNLNVVLPGSAAPDEVAQWLHAADLLALPSYAEGCPNVVLEAISCGRPVVATRVGAIPDVVDDSCGRLVSAGHIAELAGALRDVLATQWNDQAIASRSRRTWTDMARETYELCLAVAREYWEQREL